MIAGFGGQGILFMGKFLANIGMDMGKHVSWLPSYGPEMRGGTAQCGVILSDDPIGSPLVGDPELLAAMNLPSFLTFAGRVKPGGHMFYDCSLVSEKCGREDITVRGLAATQMAEDNGIKGLASMVMAGAVLSAVPGVTKEIIESAMEKTVPERKKDMIDMNMKAVMLGLAGPA
jgi:2-oxoglutarate ferredoxin oxidoreductase subunit gamma